MNLFGAMIAGLAGTIAMTSLIFIGPMPGRDIIDLLGSTFSGDKALARILGIGLHLLLGILSGIMYAMLWSLGVFSPTWLSGLLFGLGHGVVVSLMMPHILMMHPRNPTLERSLLWVVGLLLVHLVFGVTTALSYAPFAS